MGVALCTFILRELLYLYNEGRLKIYTQELAQNISDHRCRELHFLIYDENKAAFVTF
jgi:hypothetical protein